MYTVKIHVDDAPYHLNFHNLDSVQIYNIADARGFIGAPGCTIEIGAAVYCLCSVVMVGHAHYKTPSIPN